LRMGKDRPKSSLPAWRPGENEMSDESRTHCIRCGTCCQKGSPTLLNNDAEAVLQGRLPLEALYTIRVGELVHDPIEGRAGIAAREMVKIREKRPFSSCVFYDGDQRACTIYERRPSQCVALECWNLSEFMRVYEGPKVQRTDLVHDESLLKLMMEHEERCGYGEIAHWVWAIPEKGEAAVQEVIKMLRFDYELRPLAARKLGLPEARMSLYFGRPLLETITMFGLQVVRSADGTFLLTMLPHADEGKGLSGLEAPGADTDPDDP